MTRDDIPYLPIHNLEGLRRILVTGPTPQKVPGPWVAAVENRRMVRDDRTFGHLSCPWSVIFLLTSFSVTKSRNLRYTMLLSTTHPETRAPFNDMV